MARGTLIFDIETLDADLLYTTPADQFVRLIGYRWRGKETVLTTDLEEIRAQIMKARWVIGHNIHTFDLPAVFGPDSDIPMWLTDQGRVYDTWTHAALVNPAPNEYDTRDGVHKKIANDRDGYLKSWFSLDNQLFQLGHAGKTDDLKALAYEFGDPELPKKLRIKDGFGRIPLDDQRYRDYLRGDVDASERLGQLLLAKGPLDAYALREQRIEARKAVIQANGIRVDTARAQARVDELTARREVIMADLVDRYDFPTEGDAPWSTTEGKAAILAALADQGIRPDENWPKTPAWAEKSKHLAKTREKIEKLESQLADWHYELDEGDLPARSQEARKRWIAANEEKIRELKANPLPVGFGLSFGGDELIELTRGTAAEDLGRALAELKGQRSLAQLALDSVHSDGFAHPEINMLQRSGRWSTTKPGLTVWTARGEGAIEKSYFIPDNEDEVLLEIDYSNADARIVAALSGDRKYAERFEEGADGHLINAWAAWGKDVVGTDKHDPVTAEYRQKAKPLGHGWNYGGGWKTLSREAGVPEEDAKAFCEGMAKAFKRLIRWQEDCRAEARKYGYVTNDWGRKMLVDRDRLYTQAPALPGQNGTREIVCDAILRMPYKAVRRIKLQVHDALLFSVPLAVFDESRDYFCRVMTAEFKPKKGGQLIEFPVTAGPPGRNWEEAGHE